MYSQIFKLKAILIRKNNKYNNINNKNNNINNKNNKNNKNYKELVMSLMKIQILVNSIIFNGKYKLKIYKNK